MNGLRSWEERGHDSHLHEYHGRRKTSNRFDMYLSNYAMLPARFTHANRPMIASTKRATRTRWEEGERFLHYKTYTCLGLNAARFQYSFQDIAHLERPPARRICGHHTPMRHMIPGAWLAQEARANTAPDILICLLRMRSKVCFPQETILWTFRSFIFQGLKGCAVDLKCDRRPQSMWHILRR